MASAYAASASNTRPIARRTGKCGHAGSVIVDDNAAHATPAANHTPSSIEPCREAAIAAAIAIDVPRLAAVAPSARASDAANTIANVTSAPGAGGVAARADTATATPSFTPNAS